MTNHWDPDGLRKRIYNNEDLFAALLKSFLSDLSKNSETLLNAAQALELKKLKEISHLLKGVSGQLCANELHQICVNIEQVSLTPKEQVDTAQLETLCANFSQELSIVEQLFRDALTPDSSNTTTSSHEGLGKDEFISQIRQLQTKLDQSEYIDPESLNPLKNALQNNQSIQDLVKRLIDEINLFDNIAASTTLKEIITLASAE